jgi:hypothetical protein
MSIWLVDDALGMVKKQATCGAQHSPADVLREVPPAMSRVVILPLKYLSKFPFSLNM